MKNLPQDWKDFIEAEIKFCSGNLVTGSALYNNDKKLEGEYYINQSIMAMSIILEAIKTGKLHPHGA